MAALKSLGVRNLRSLRAIDPPVRIAPITVLLGRNSVGKSTFARIFPLLRQSSERKKKSPVLWFGDLVDFGSLERAVTAGEREVGFTFNIECDIPSRRGSYTPWYEQKKTKKILAEVSITLAEDEEQKTGYAKNITVKFLGSSISIDPPPQSPAMTAFTVNGQTLLPGPEQAVVSWQGDILPLLYFYKETKNSEGVTSWVAGPNHWDDLPTQIVRRMVHNNTSTSTCRKIARQVSLGTEDEIAEALTSIPGPQSWTNITRSSRVKQMAKELHQALIVSHVGEILSELDNALRTYFQGVRYLKPLRATAERYYRKLDLSVSEIDPDGSNLPMFLDSLPMDELLDFREWCQSYLGVDAYPKREGDQMMVMAQGKNDAKAFNIADMGFGISQVLPIAAQLWASTRSLNQGRQASAIVLEQPELHLHPDSQARLADVFAGTIRAAKDANFQNASIIVETHSQHLVNRLGQLVESGQLDPRDISILLFEAAKGSTPCTTVRISEFSEKGVLKNWPFGFFEPEQE